MSASRRADAAAPSTMVLAGPGVPVTQLGPGYYRPQRPARQPQHRLFGPGMDADLGNERADWRVVLAEPYKTRGQQQLMAFLNGNMRLDAPFSLGG